MDHSKLKIQQEVQTRMLAEFDTFCREHGLTYYMAYGTLLGAVRHHGFIPWDNDVDTFMTRKEYEKFMKVQNQLPDNLHIDEICYSDIRHAGLARLCLNHELLGHVHIDIFILDYEKNSFLMPLTRLLHFAKLSKSEKKILVKHFKGQPLKQTIVHLSKGIRFLLGGSANAERLIFKLRVSKYPSLHYITLEDIKHFPVDFYGNPQLLDFDGHKFYAPIHTDKILAESYGDYMKIPPEGLAWLEEEKKSQV